ncbi:MAG: hypoxanthine phosphoribosyltransferase [Erysipelotrichaceae bacterium]|nr:hypoxanthine phosphoribosyltransferase [Erysipelotrichaceae bacterium]
MHKDIGKVLITEEEIIARTKEMGKMITDDYAEEEPVVVGLLKGSVPFMAELIKQIRLDIEIDFMDVSSYVGTESEGDVRIVKDLDRSIVGRKVLIVEDIIDTGKTLTSVKELMYKKGASDVRIATLLDKPSRRKVQIEGEYVGFEVPNEFVVGYGLDFNQKYRNLPYIGVLKEECYKE